MIHPQDLRVGNLINTPSGVQMITGFQTGLVNVIYFKDGHIGRHMCDGIPLTQEWLERCQIPEGVFKDALHKNLCRDGSGNYDGWWVALKYSKDAIYKPVSIRIHYVHQFQNLFHALTGSELEIKLP